MVMALLHVMYSNMLMTYLVLQRPSKLMCAMVRVVLAPMLGMALHGVLNSGNGCALED